MSLSWPARIYIGGVVAAATSVALGAFAGDPAFDAGTTAVLAVLFLLTEAFPVALPRGGAYSVSFVVALAAIVTQGPAGAVLVAAAGTLNVRGIRSHPAPIASRLFNGANFVICTGLAALVYRATGGPIGDALLASPGRAALPVLAATGVNFAANTSLVATMLSLVMRRFRASPAAIWRSEFASLLPGYFAFAVIGVLLGLLLVEVHVAAVLFVLVPLLVARSAFAAAVRIQNAYETTIEALVTAIEAKDRYTRDHAGRVARLTELVARESGMRGERLHTMRLAALMHDVGKLGVPTAVLVKPGKLTAEEYDTMKDHPIRGSELLAGVDVLRDAMAGVRHHHERLDGSGYPDGLRGDEIPVEARLIMVCDAFDSMTSTRAYRPAKSTAEAIAELRRCSGTQFDPKAIDALERAISRHGWKAEPEIDRVVAPSHAPMTRREDRNAANL